MQILSLIATCTEVFLVQYVKRYIQFIQKYYIELMELSTQNENRRKGLLQPTQNLQHIQFAELQRSVNQLLQQNYKKHQQITELRPNFQYKLYKVAQNKSQSLNFGRQLLMRQLDRLMEQENYLNRELSLISFQRQQSLSVKEELITTQINSFEVLRNVWTAKNQQYGSALQHVESLNEIVGSIKLSIRKLSQIQKNNHVQHTNDYFHKMLQEQQKKVKCQKCQQMESSKKQLRGTVGKLSNQIIHLNNRTKQLQEEIEIKDELIRKMAKKSMQNQTQLKSKMMYLQQKLILEEHQIKILSKFKADLEKNVFCNEEEKYQIYFKTQEDLSAFSRNIRIDLYQILDVITNQEAVSSNNGFRSQQQIQETKAEIQQNISIRQLLLPDLALPIGLSKDSKSKTSITQRPRTDRKRPGFGPSGVQKLQDIEQSGKKYMRTNQLTTKRNKGFVYSPIQSKNTQSTLKLGDSPKSIQQLNERV